MNRIARTTRIGVETLGLIESEDLSRLPAEVYVKGFLRAYAKAVGADGEEAVRLYLEDLDSLRSANRSEREMVRTRERFGLRLLLVLALLLCIMGLSVYLDRLWFSSDSLHEAGQSSEGRTGPAAKAPPAPSIQQPEDSTEHSATKNVSFQTPAPGATTGRAQAAAQPKKGDGKNFSDDVPQGEADEKGPEKLHLEVITLEKTWLKVIADAGDPREYTLKPSDRLQLEAASGFNLLIGNAAGVRLFVNNKPVHVGGKRGQVVTLQIPRRNR